MAPEAGVNTSPRRILISGASGMIGTPLRRALTMAGHTVHTLVRREPIDPLEHRWNPEAGTIESGIVDHVDVVINLSGASIGKIPWTKAHKKLILSSRISATSTLVTAITSAATPPSLLVQGSAVGFYGDRGDEVLTEKSPKGEGFLSDVVAEWENAASGAANENTRVVFARTGLVVGKGGAMSPLVLQTKLGVGGSVGNGRQWWPWISLHDEVRALHHLATYDTDFTVFNLVGPQTATANDVTKELSRALRRPHLIGLPTFAIKAVLGEAGVELLLSSQRITSKALEVTGFSWDDPSITSAIARMLGRRT